MQQLDLGYQDVFGLIHWSKEKCSDQKTTQNSPKSTVRSKNCYKKCTVGGEGVMRMFEFLVVAVIEEMVGDSFNPHFTESMTLRSFPSENITLMSFPTENINIRSFPSE